MTDKNYKSAFTKFFWIATASAAVLVLILTFVFSRYIDRVSTERRLTTMIESIKVQSMRYVNYNNTVAAKSFLRMSRVANHLKTKPETDSITMLGQYAKEFNFTGMAVLDDELNLVSEYTQDGLRYSDISRGLSEEVINKLLSTDNETYVNRVQIDDGSYADVAAVRGEDDASIVIVYAHTASEFVSRSVLSIQDILDGYTVKDTGTVVITDGSTVTASNNRELIGRDISNNITIQGIRASGTADKLVQVNRDAGLGSNYGMYSQGRTFTAYAYLPSSAVFTSTLTNLTIAMLFYLIVIGLYCTLRWNSFKTASDKRAELEKEYNLELKKKNDELELAIRHEEAANKSKRDFLFNMSHDIRTPMNAIIGFTSLAATHMDNKEQLTDYLKKISVSSQHLLSLINDVLDMSRIESGKVKIEEKPVHLPDLIHDVRAIILPNITAKRLSLFIDIMDVTDEDIITDPLRLNQVLLNILSNAIKYTPAGGTVTLRILQKTAAVNGSAEYEFRIKDTGIGMSSEFVKHIFEEFTREETSTVSGIQGTGLGMAITKNIVDMMNGTISVKSKPGQGSEFTVNVCFAVNSEHVGRKSIPQLEGLRALVADDDTDSCLNISKMLRKIGLRPDWTISGKEAVVRTRDAYEQGDAFSVYIIDWQIPDMNGVEVVRRVRKIIGNDTPIIILTAYDWSDIEEEAREAGVTAFCTKPLFMSELQDILAAPFEVREEKNNAETAYNSFSGKKLLLAEDNVLNREIACEILKEMGFIVDTANDGAEAVEKISSSIPGRYDIVLMDIQMPNMDGYEATRCIRELADSSKANIPIIAMTANAFEEDRQNAINSGMNGHIPKPIDVKKLTETIMAVMSGISC